MSAPAGNVESKYDVPSKRTWLRRLAIYLRRAGLLIFGTVVLYLICALVGLIPANRDFVPADSSSGVKIYVYSGAVHSDIIVPIRTPEIDWRNHFSRSDFRRSYGGATHFAIGWGDRGFYLDTPYWSDLTATTAAKAILVPSSTVMHVQLARPKENNECKPVTISHEQYARLVDYILNSFAKSDDDSLSRIDFSYDDYDAFYEATGSYHAFNTCNCWVANGLKTAGVETPWFSPVPRTVLWYFPDSEH
ncbi:MAG: TIGR02117 family protein [Planctomycetales bacterium]|nr:TIGR02117 family protein [Planctomycetales bacterium]